MESYRRDSRRSHSHIASKNRLYIRVRQGLILLAQGSVRSPVLQTIQIIS